MSEDSTAKTCTKCGETKSLSEFNKDKMCRGGHKGQCKACVAAYNKEYNSHNREKRVRATARWRARNLEYVRALGRAYRARNKGKYAERERAYNARRLAEYPERRRAYNVVEYAIRKGDLVRPSDCSRCGATKELDAHHVDYSTPLDVVWVCRVCHRALHQLEKNQ